MELKFNDGASRVFFSLGILNDELWPGPAASSLLLLIIGNLCQWPTCNFILDNYLNMIHGFLSPIRSDSFRKMFKTPFIFFKFYEFSFLFRLANDQTPETLIPASLFSLS